MDRFLQLLQAFLKMRSSQLARALQGLSWYHILVLSSTAALLLLWLYRKMHELAFAGVAVAGALLLVFFVHTLRSDKRFVEHLTARHELIFFIEYSLLLLPLHILLLMTGHWLLIFPLEALLLLVSFLKLRIIAKTRVRSIPFVHRQKFEWKAGIRKNFWHFIFIYAFGLLLTPYPIATFLVLWLLLVLVSSFYQECEPHTLLLLSGKGPVPFLSYKLRLQLLQYTVITFPLLLLHLIFQPAYALLALAAYTSLLLVLISLVLLKYAHYEATEKVTSAAMLPSALNLASPLLPFLLLFPIVSSMFNYRNAIQRLKPFLHDFDS